MGRHPDPRPGEDAVTPPEPPVADPAPARPPRRRRAARLAGRLVVVVLALALGGWAALNAAGPATAERLGSVAAASIPAGGDATSPSARATASASPTVGGSPAAPSPAATPQPAQGAPEPLDRPRVTTVPVGALLQAQLDRLRTRLGIPGVSATVIFRDGTSWTGASGLADVNAKVAVEDDTAFAVGSVSKTYTAALILALVGDGKIDLDKPGAAYLPGHPLDKRITV